METQGQKRVLVGNLPSPVLEHLQSFLNRSNFHVDYLPSSRAIYMLMQKVEFDLLIIGTPIETVDPKEIFRDVRTRENPNFTSSLLVLARPEDLEEYRKFMGKGISGILPIYSDPSEVERTIGALTHIAPRVAARIMLKLRVHMDTRQGALLCQTVNLSMSGMLVQTSMQYDVNAETSFEFKLPGDSEPVSGQAVIARHTIGSREKARGMGLKFLSFNGNSEQRLYSFLKKHLI